MHGSPARIVAVVQLSRAVKLGHEQRRTRRTNDAQTSQPANITCCPSERSILSVTVMFSVAVRLAVVVVLAAAMPSPSANAQAAPPGDTLADAQRAFYNARYEEAAALTMVLASSGDEDLAVFELRSSALLFQLKKALAGASDKQTA